MKPTRNRIFCYGCHRPKMLFETQQKADNFIRYNSETILTEHKKAPVRSYYCEMCGGWHVTSNPSEDMGEELDKREHDIIQGFIALKHKNEINVEEIRILRVKLSEIFSVVESSILYGKIDEARELTKTSISEINDYLKTHVQHGTERLVNIREKFNRIIELTDLLTDIISLSEEEQAYYISNLNSQREKETIRFAITNIKNIEEIDKMLSDNENMLANDKTDNVYENLTKCSSLMTDFRGIGRSKIHEKYAAKITEQQDRLSMLSMKTTEAETNLLIRHTSEPVDKDEYKKIIISLIDRLETIQKSYNDADYDSCETSLEIAYYMLDELHTNDDNTALIKQQLEQWSERINNLNS